MPALRGRSRDRYLFSPIESFQRLKIWYYSLPHARRYRAIANPIWPGANMLSLSEIASESYNFYLSVAESTSV